MKTMNDWRVTPKWVVAALAAVTAVFLAACPSGGNSLSDAARVWCEEHDTEIVGAALTLGIAPEEVVNGLEYEPPAGSDQLFDWDAIERAVEEANESPDLWPTYDVPSGGSVAAWVFDTQSEHWRDGIPWFAVDDYERVCRAAYEASDEK